MEHNKQVSQAVVGIFFRFFSLVKQSVGLLPKRAIQNVKIDLVFKYTKRNSKKSNQTIAQIFSKPGNVLQL